MKKSRIWLVPWTIGTLTWIGGLAINNLIVWGLGMGILIGYITLQILDVFCTTDEVKN